MSRLINYTFFTKLQCDELLTEQVTIDNIILDGNTISSSSGDINITPLAGQDIVLDGHWEIDGPVMTALTDNNTTINAYTGKNITIEGVTFDGGIVTATTFSGALTGAATQVGTAATSSGTNSVLVAGTTTGDQAVKTVSGFTIAGATGALAVPFVTSVFRGRMDTRDAYNAAANYGDGAGASITTTTQAGKMFFLNGSATQTITLPAVATSTGWNFTFFSKTDQTLVINCPSGTLIAPGNAAATTITFDTTSQSTIGACVYMYCDGTNWYAVNQCALTMGVS